MSVCLSFCLCVCLCVCIYLFVWRLQFLMQGLYSRPAYWLRSPLEAYRKQLKSGEGFDLQKSKFVAPSSPYLSIMVCINACPAIHYHIQRQISCIICTLFLQKLNNELETHSLLYVVAPYTPIIHLYLRTLQALPEPVQPPH